jgi:hypothetical protein
LMRANVSCQIMKDRIKSVKVPLSLFQ